MSQLWFKRFSSGDVNLEDQPRSGRPSVVDDDTLRQAVEEQPCTSTRRLSAELGPSQPTIQRHLHQLGLVNRRCRQIPHELTATQAQQRLDLCKELLAHPHDMRFFRRIVTGDEKWIFFRNPNKENQWLYPGMPAQPVVKQGRFDCKVMLCVWWNFEGLVSS